MSSQRVFLVVVLTAILSGYVGWFYARKVDLLAVGTFALRGMSVSVTAAGEIEPNRLSPTIAVTKCGIGKFSIRTETEGMETAVVRASELTPTQLGCLLDQAQTEMHGEPPPAPGTFLDADAPGINSYLHDDARGIKSYRPLHLTFNAAPAQPKEH